MRCRIIVIPLDHQLRRLCVGLFGFLAVLSVGSAAASMIARQDVLSSIRVNDRWELPKAVGRDMAMAVVWTAIATRLGRTARG